MRKEEYEELQIELITFENTDVVTASNDINYEDSETPIVL